MTRRLLLLRHAKSSWDDPSLADRDRPLSGRGRRAAERMGRYLVERELVPVTVLCSPSLRTRETLERLALGVTNVELEDLLYGATADELRTAVRDVSDDVDPVLVIGHNPGMQDLAVDLAGDQPGDDADRLRAKFPTAALAVFEVDGSWSELAAERSRLVSLVVPKELS